MTKREIVKQALEGKPPPYVPWHFIFSAQAAEKLGTYFESSDFESIADNHLIRMGSVLGFFTDLGENCVQDHFGVIWDRSIDKTFGYIKEPVLKEPSLKGYEFPFAVLPRFVEDIPGKLESYGDRFRVFNVGLSLFERAWSLRGMENILMDFHDHPAFVHELFHVLCDYNISMVRMALAYDIDAVYFLDDWGQQHGLIMGPILWHEFIFPVLKRMYDFVRDAGKKVMIHSCGDIQELFDNLIGIGVDCFNPLQPEVMDALSIMKAYRGRLSFYGGISTQRTLPFGSADALRSETQQLIDMGIHGGYLCAPSQSVEGDVPIDNILALIDTVKNQQGYLQNK
ncbi:MAG: uroporphyrinogen-III decarboxylase-like protein [Candidatus Latescibacteria bacterium]|nr:uroporphyrinogen-III decarboxylase-like protein [Candidatus Latescibacterota bacterium]